MNRWILLGILAAGPASAAGWTQPEGGHYARVVNRIVSGAKGYDRHGVSQRLFGTYDDWQLVAYGEYGLTDAVTLVAQLVPVGHASFEGEEIPHSGPYQAAATYVGPLSVGARFGLPFGPVRLAVEGRYGYAPPIGDKPLIEDRFFPWTPEKEAFTYTPAVSHHRFDGELQVGVGLPWGFWLSGSGGARAIAGADIDPALIGFAQLGWTSPWGLVVEAHFNALHPLGPIEANNIAGSGETRYIGRGIGLSWWLTDHVALTVGQDGGFGVRSNAAALSRIIGVELR